MFSSSLLVTTFFELQGIKCNWLDLGEAPHLLSDLQTNKKNTRLVRFSKTSNCTSLRAVSRHRRHIHSSSNDDWKSYCTFDVTLFRQIIKRLWELTCHRLSHGCETRRELSRIFKTTVNSNNINGRLSYSLLEQYTWPFLDQTWTAS